MLPRKDMIKRCLISFIEDYRKPQKHPPFPAHTKTQRNTVCVNTDGYSAGGSSHDYEYEPL